MRSRTYRAIVPPVAPESTARVWPAVRLVILLVAALFVVIPAMRWIGERQTVQRAIAQPAPAAQVVELSTDIPGLPLVRFNVESADNGYILTDIDGDRFLCATLPTVIADMEMCPYAHVQSD